MLHMKTVNEMLEENVACKKCGTKVSELAVFPGRLCLACHEVKYNLHVKLTGKLPEPNFFAAIGK